LTIFILGSMMLLCLLLIGDPVPSLDRVRALYGQCMINEDSCKVLSALLKVYDERNAPLLAGYRAAATMVMAKYTFNPLVRWKYFRQGRDLLERSVAVDGRDVELIFIRYSIQQNCPGFLHYRQWIEQDRKFIESNVDRISDPEMRRTIKRYLTKTRT
jgi:hypothetical protein